MNARTPPAKFLGLAVVSAVLLLSLGLATAGLRCATADDEAIQRGLSNPAQALGNRMHDFRIGRIYADVKFDLLEAWMCVPSEAAHTAIRLGAFMTAVLAMGWFVWEWRRSAVTAGLVGMVGLGFLPVSIGYQALLSYPLLWFGWAGVWAMGAMALRPDTVAMRGGIAVAFALALAVHEANAAFLVWPAILRWAGGVRGAKAVGREFYWCGLVLAVYGLLSLWLREAAMAAVPGGFYEGAKVALNLREAVHALNVYTWSGLPALDSWLARMGDISGPLWLSPHGWLQRVVAWASPLTLLGAVLLGVAVWLGTAPGEQEADRHSPISRVRMVVALGFAAFAPNLLLSFTVKYQEWAHQRMWPYYYTSMSYLVWVVLLVSAALAVLASIRPGMARNTARAGLVLVVTLAALGVGAANREASAQLKRHTFYHMLEYQRWFASP